MITRVLLSLLPLALFLTACDLEDWANRLPYAGPVEVSIDAGTQLPGTGIEYLGKTEDGARVLIRGKAATKKTGDSLEWRSEMVRGVSVHQTYRVAVITDKTLHAIGTVRVIVMNPSPEVGAVDETAPVHFTLPVGYHVEKGKPIPGTTFTYLGKTEQGAELGNTGEYPYRRVGDSIVWKGKLRDGVWLELDLRTALIADDNLDVIGTAGLWLAPTDSETNAP
jgi:hypothetical protein